MEQQGTPKRVETALDGTPEGSDTAAQREQDILATYGGARLLCGPWRLRLDPDNAGKAGAWHLHEPPDEALTIVVPSSWQEYVDYPGGVAWYYKDFVVPAEMAGQMLRLKFWAVDYFAEVWVNGHYCGSHEGGYTPFAFDITESAHSGGANRLVVRVVDPPRPPNPAQGHMWQGAGATLGSADGFDLLDIPMGLQSWIEGLSFSGIWQPVELLGAPRLHISDIFLEPRRSGVLDVHVEVTNTENAPAPATLRVVIAPWVASSDDRLLGEHGGGRERGPTGSGQEGEGVQEAHLLQTFGPGISAADLHLVIRAPHEWSVDDPYLYVATVTVEREGHAAQHERVRFGLRDFTIKDGYFHLNDCRIFIKGGHYQGTYPTTLGFPPTRAMAYRDMELMKEAGFNFVRLWGKPTPTWVLDAADELGLLLQEEPPLSVMRDGDQMLARAEREVSELVMSHRNRPSIVVWNMINELAPATKVVQHLCLIARRLDPTRLITENNGGRSRYYLPYSEEGVSYLTEHSYPGAPIGEEVLDYWQRRGAAGRLFFVSEYGFGGMDDVAAVLAWYGPHARRHMEDYQGYAHLQERRDRAFAGSVWERTFGTMENLRQASQAMQAEAIRMHTEALRANAACGALNLVQLIDSNAFEVDGIVDFTRREHKAAFVEMQRLNKPLVLIVQCTPANVRSGAAVRVTVTLVNEESLQGRAELSLRVHSPAGTEAWARVITVAVRPWVSVVFDDGVPISGPSGRYVVEAVLRQEDAAWVQGSHFCTVVHPDDVRWPGRPFALFDPETRLGPFLHERGVAYRDFDPQSTHPQAIVAAPFSVRTLSPADYGRLLRLFEMVERGGTALFPALPRSGEGWAGQPIWDQGHGMLSVASLGGIFPFRVTEQAARWHGRVGPYAWGVQAPLAGTPVPDHPIFEGVPRGLMGAPYANVAPLRGITTDARPVEDLGAVQVYAHGQGAIILSSLNLLPHLRTDALAEKLLANLVLYGDHLLRVELAPPRAETHEAITVQEQEYEDVRQKFPVPNS